ncbi:MAG: hypothetical protein IJA95_03715 [Bacteroidaceae bacterium]|nr:hypothetical protein [Bacteroidaceae bacterium]
MKKVSRHFTTKVLPLSILLVSLVFCGCNKIKNPYFIEQNDTIAFLINKNDSLKIAEIENRKFNTKDDSIYHRIYNYFELNGKFTSYITDNNVISIGDSTEKKYQNQYKLILDEQVDTIAYLEYESYLSKKGVIITPTLIKEEKKLREIANVFNLNECKFFNSFNKGKYDMDYYAYYKQEKATFYEKPFIKDTLRILDYLSNLPGIMRFSGNDKLYSEEDVHKWALAIRDIGELAKKCKKNESKLIKKASENLIDSLTTHQKMFFWGLRTRYGKILERIFSDYEMEIFVDEFFENTIMQASCDYFVSEDYAIKFLNARDNILRALNLRKVRFNWSMRAWLDYYYPILPTEWIHRNDYIGWRYDHKWDLEDILDVTLRYYEPSLFK